MTLMSRILLLFGICCLFVPRASADTPQVFDIRQAADGSKAFTLQAPWDFYWMKFVDPFDHSTAPDFRIPAGKGWRQANPELPAHGFATYRLQIKGFNLYEKGYELSLPYILSAYRLTMYPENDPGRVIQHQLGTPGKTAKDNDPETLLQTIAFRPLGPEEVWIISIHMACYEHANCGFRAAPLIGPAPELSRRWRYDMDSALFCAGILFIMFLYNLMLFVRRPEDKASLLASLAILSIAVRSIATSNMPYYLTGRTGRDILEFIHVLEYLTLTGSGILFSYFLQQTFLPASYPRLLKTVSILFSPLIAAVMIFPAEVYTRLLPLYQLSTAFFIGLGFWVVIRAWRMRLDGSLTVFLGGLCILVSFVYDILVIYGIMPRPFTLQYATALYVFLASETLAQQFAKAFRMAEKLQRDLKKEVVKQTAEIKQIMASIPQGIFTMGPRLCIEGQYSQHLEFILQTEALEGREALPLLFAHSNIDAERLSMLRSALLASLGEDLIVWDFNQHCLITEFQVQNPQLGLRIFELDWHPIASTASRIEQILVTLRDVTDWRKLQEVNRQREEELNLILELVPIPESRWRDFVKQSQQLLEKAGTADPKLTAIALHTLKGLARSIGCRHLSVAIHAIEDNFRVKPQDIGRAPLQNSLNELRQLLARYENLWTHKLTRGHDHREDNQSSLIEELAYRRQQLRDSSQAGEHLPELLNTLDRYLQQSLYVSLFALLRELTESMAPLATELNRIPPEIHLEGCDHWIHRRGANVLRMSLVHLIRNALDHGLESPAERQSKGKNPRGRILWSVQAGQGTISISCRDDGRGLDMESLLTKALELGYSRDQLEALPHGLADAMFISGLSSRDTVSEVSGRGVGMDALRTMVSEAGGRVWARLLPADPDSSEHTAFETIIEMPADLFLGMQDPVPLSA